MSDFDYSVQLALWDLSGTVPVNPPTALPREGQERKGAHTMGFKI
jgi:hypothetical protein